MTSDPVQLTLMVLGGAVAALLLLVKLRKAPLRREIGEWATSHGFKFHPIATLDLSRQMGLPLTIRYEHVIAADMPGNNTAFICRKKDVAQGPKIRLQAESEDDLPGDLGARISLSKSVSGRAILVPRGEKPPTSTLMMAPSASAKMVNPSKRYDMYTDGIMEPKDFPGWFYEALDAFPAKKTPVLVIDQVGIWIDDPVHRGSSADGYEKLHSYCNKLCGTLAKWTPPPKAAFK